MPERFKSGYDISYQPDYATTWKAGSPCKCVPAIYEGIIPYFDTNHFPEEFVKQNSANQDWCQRSIYEAPQIYNLNNITAPCLNTPI